ncbi:MAG TPA: metal ABC transporter permease [Solirubrobacterales bacterium]|jgi:ABC-type Mn2+/Zn2+ transport system permease subunit|nr:metal ABC transporter permease [Solirubrobacterales bacterium]
MLEWLTDPFSAEFVRTGALAAAVVGVLCGVVGCYVVMRGMALVADSLAHGVLPGVAIAFALTAGTSGAEPDEWAIWAGALIAGLLTAGATSLIIQRSRVREETAAGVVFVFMLALGVAIASRVEGYSVDLTAFLFGDVLGVTDGEVALSAALTAAVLALVAVFYRPFLMTSFDPQRAAALGMPVDRLHLVMLVIVTLAVVIGFRVVGALLVLGLLIAPPATAALVTKRLPSMMAVSAGIAALAAPVGLLLSWHLDIAAGASIVLAAVSAFVVALFARAAPR